MITTIFYLGLCLYGSTVIHELGHYFAARWVAIPLTAFQIGTGPTVLTFSLQGVRFRFRLLPFGGHVAMPVFSMKPSAKNRWRYHLFYAAGPMANLMFAGLVFTIAGFSEPLLIINLATGFGNLLPLPGFDGHCLWHLYKHQRFSGEFRKITQRSRSIP